MWRCAAGAGVQGWRCTRGASSLSAEVWPPAAACVQMQVRRRRACPPERQAVVAVAAHVRPGAGAARPGLVAHVGALVPELAARVLQRVERRRLARCHVDAVRHHDHGGAGELVLHPGGELARAHELPLDRRPPAAGAEGVASRARGRRRGAGAAASGARPQERPRSGPARLHAAGRPRHHPCCCWAASMSDPPLGRGEVVEEAAADVAQVQQHHQQLQDGHRGHHRHQLVLRGVKRQAGGRAGRQEVSREAR